jgi:alpha-glucosidase
MAQNAGQALWWQRGVIYQVYPRSFKDHDGDGIGDLKGVIAKLDYFSEVLGIEAIWLSPVYPSPMKDFGYDISNMVDIHPMFGSLSDFDTLVTEAHRRNIHIIMDFVPNHTSDQHPWFVESRSSKDNPKRNWYFWRDAKPDGSLPNNWLSVFGGPAWELDATTGQYYLHTFLVEQPDINWRNPEVRAAMIDVLRFWLDRGVDGFRLDATHFMMKDANLSDNPLNPDLSIGFKSLGAYDSQLHIHDQAHPDIHDIFREIRALLDAYGERDGKARFSVGEIHMTDLQRWVSFYGEHLDELHMPFNFHFLFANWNAQTLQNIIETGEHIIPEGAWPNFVLGNHDEHRVASRVGADAARMAMMLLLTLRGTPTIYYGDEIGMHDVDIPPELEQDPWGKNVAGIGLGRDPERTPMQWDASPNAGFSAAGVATWLPVADDYTEINVATELQDPRSMLSLTRRLLALRRETPALYSGHYQTVQHQQTDCLVFKRELDGDRWIVALNFAAVDQTLNLLLPDSARVVISTELDREESVSLGNLHLRPHEGCLIKLG